MTRSVFRVKDENGTTYDIVEDNSVIRGRKIYTAFMDGLEIYDPFNNLEDAKEIVNSLIEEAKEIKGEHDGRLFGIN